MDTSYIEYSFVVTPKEIGTEILIAELGAAGFESFVENETGCQAYIQKQDWKSDILQEISILNSEEFTISFKHQEVAQTNWNEEWEKNFNPIEVAGKVHVRAPFHENQLLDYDIVIEPKMSFGTGHHETTHMMIQHMLGMDFTGKKVLDMGCGTGILAIFAEMKGALSVDAIDIDPWCYQNSLENVARNDCQRIAVFEGDVNLLNNKQYDVIIANINRNILIQDLGAYVNSLEEKGQILLSGFYTEDEQILEDKASTYGLNLLHKKDRNNWLSLHYTL